MVLLCCRKVSKISVTRIRKPTGPEQPQGATSSVPRFVIPAFAGDWTFFKNCSVKEAAASP
jgi:hypothetical protein